MRLFEFEAKALLKGCGIPVPSGRIVNSAEEVLIERPSVLKAQTPAGERKKAGGVAFVMNQEEARIDGIEYYDRTVSIDEAARRAVAQMRCQACDLAMRVQL